MFDVLQPSSNKVVHRHDVVVFFDKPIAEMRAQETCSTSNQYAFLLSHLSRNCSATNALVVNSFADHFFQFKQISAIK